MKANGAGNKWVKMSKKPRTDKSQASVNASGDSSARWTFLTNHAHVLAVLDSDPEIVVRQIAVQVGITERAVQRIIQELEEGGFISRTRVGRQNRYRVLANQSLRHPIESHRKIGDLLRLINKYTFVN